MLLTNPEKSREIALNGYNYVLRNYSWEKETAKIEELISKTIIK
jgi:glycosyltransferase involved in cell wall biosynthesis